MLKKLFGKFQYNAPAILTLTLLCAASLGLNYLTGGWTNKYIFSVYRTRLTDPMQYVRMITYVIGHADYAHFLGNFTVILLVGPMLEEKYGSKRLLQLIAITALATGLVHILLFPNTGLLGASGIDFAFILLASITGSRRSGEIPLTLILVAVIYCGQQVYDGLFTADNVSQLSHLIGGAIGTIFGLRMSPKRRY